jgi:hypothetical protein
MDGIVIPLSGKYANGRSTTISVDDQLTFANRALLCTPLDYASVYNKGKMSLLHRVIMGVEDPKVFVDHINGDPLDNRRENLRLCSASQNQANRKPAPGRKYKGVTKNKSGTYSASIQMNKKLHGCGTFKTEEEAALAYNRKALELFGDFAYQNIIEA